MSNRHFLVKFWKCQKAVSILPHEAKALQELFYLPPTVFGWRQNSSSSYFATQGKIKTHDFTLADQDWIGPMIFKNLADQDWIGFNFIRSGLDSDWKISQSPHVWYIHDFLLAQILKLCNAIHQHRRSQEGKGGHTTPKFLKFLVVLCFERQFRKQSTVARLKSTFLGKKKKIFVWLRRCTSAKI